MKRYCQCYGCLHEIWECFVYQEMGLNAGLEFDDVHLSFFVIDPITNKFTVPYYGFSQEEGKE